MEHGGGNKKRGKRGDVSRGGGVDVKMPPSYGRNDVSYYVIVERA